MKIDLERKYNKNALGLIVVIITMFAFLFLTEPQYFSYDFFNVFSMRIAENLVLAIGVTVVFISGGFDLSFASVMVLSAAIFGTLYNLGVPFLPALVCGFLVGILSGALIAFFVVKLRFDPFIITLALWQILRGIVYLMLKGKTVSNLPPLFNEISKITILRIPLIFIISIILLIIVFFILNKTPLGRYIYAMGGNETAAVISGINVGKLKYIVYIMNGVLSSSAGFILAIRLNAVPPMAGLQSTMQIITAVVLGGTLIIGGEGSVISSFLGVLAMSVLVTLLSLKGISPYWEGVVLGTIIVIMLGYNSIINLAKVRLAMYRKNRQTR